MKRPIDRPKLLRSRLVAIACSTAILTAVTPSAIGAAGQPGSDPAPVPRFTLIDVGTFGGPHAELDGPAEQITSRGAILGAADTTIPDEDYPKPTGCGEPHPVLMHAFVWQDGRLIDLGALPGNTCSTAFEINSRGVGVGGSETGSRDALDDSPISHAVMFQDGMVRDLGTLPGGTQSSAISINNRGEIAGFGNNGLPDPFSMLGFATQSRSFIWRDGVMTDLGTLGGPDAVMTRINERGQISGDSYTTNSPNPGTGVPTSHPFLWSNGRMQDLGSLGGTQSQTMWMNDRGDVVGLSSLAGDQAQHPYLWDGRSLHDLGTFGGTYGIAWHVNDSGDAVGWATTTGDTAIHPFLWRRGALVDLFGAGSPQCGAAYGINNRGQIVGETCAHSALFWSQGRQYELNSLVGPTDVHLTEASYITDRGEIASLGLLPNGDQHVFLLTPTSRH